MGFSAVVSRSPSLHPHTQTYPNPFSIIKTDYHCLVLVPTSQTYSDVMGSAGTGGRDYLRETSFYGSHNAPAVSRLHSLLFRFSSSAMCKCHSLDSIGTRPLQFISRYLTVRVKLVSNSCVRKPNTVHECQR